MACLEGRADQYLRLTPRAAYGTLFSPLGAFLKVANSDEAASSLAVSVRFVDYLISDGKLRTRRMGRRVLIPSEDVKRLAAEIMQSDGTARSSRQSRHVVPHATGEH